MKSHLLSSLLTLVCILPIGLIAEPAVSFPFTDPDLPMEVRINDLVERLTLEEKADQLRYDSPGIPRLGIPEYNWWSECLHGVARNGRATVFPQAIGMAATWDTDLIHRVSHAIGIEGRAKYNACSANGDRSIYQGLTFWTPNVNIFRDPRWGRGHETYGEDPYLTSRIGVAFVEGLQGDDPNYLLAAGCAKHFAVHSGPEALRHEFNAICSQQDLWDTYLPAFEALVTEAKVEGVMGAYNRTNGDPCCAHPYLIQDVLRDQWKFDGYFTSDCWAIVDFFDGHNVVETVEDAAALALKYECNLNCGVAYQSIQKAIDQGKTSEADVDRNLKQLLKTRFRLGLFDPDGRVPFNQIGSDVISCDDHVALTRETARKSFVLLKNRDHTLPVRNDLKKIYITGPLAMHMQGLLGNYYGLNDKLVSVVEGVVGAVSDHTKVMYRQGAFMDRDNLNPMDWFSGEAGDAEVTIACLGISQLLEGEEGESLASPYKGDRVDIQLPPNQVEFLKAIRSRANKLVVVMFGGSPLAFQEVYDMADAVVFVWYPGQEGGNALADILFGKYSPSGRLPVTFPKSIEDLPPYQDYSMEGRTYRFANKEPFLPFGFGLSYTTFEYSDLKLDQNSVQAAQSLKVTVKVKNTGDFKADEVVELYLKASESNHRVPNHALKGFKRVSLAPGESQQVSFELNPKQLQIVSDEGERIFEEGRYTVFIGGSQPDTLSIKLGAPQWQQTDFSICNSN